MNTSDIGNLSQSAIVFALHKKGYRVYLPFGDGYPVDLVAERESKIFKIECKTGRICNDVIRFNAHKVSYSGESTTYVSQVDMFAVFCCENSKVYLIPFEDLCGKKNGYLRLEPSKNNQLKNVRWAKDYEV